MPENQDIEQPFALEILCADQQLVIWAYGPVPRSRELVKALESWGIQAQIDFCSPCG